MQITVIIFLEVILLDGYKLIKLSGSATGTNELNGIMKKGKKKLYPFLTLKEIQLLWFVVHVIIIKL